MKKTFQKTLIAAAAGVALMSAVGTASANSLLFPYFTTESGNTSIVSLYGGTNQGTTSTAIHYVYNYGSACTHFDGLGKLTANDLLQHTVGSTAAGGFGKVVAADTSVPFYLPVKDYGFLVVTSRDAVGQITGDMIVYNPTAGIVTSYPAVDNGALDSSVASGNEGNFNSITDTRFNLGFYPTSLVTTSWYGVVVGNMNAAITAGSNWLGAAKIANGGAGATNTGGVFGVYDNDENALSGAMTKSLVCGGIVNPSDLMNSAQQAVVGPNGGLIHAVAVPDAATQATGVVMTKIQVLTTTKAGLLHREPSFARF